MRKIISAIALLIAAIAFIGHFAGKAAAPARADEILTPGAFTERVAAAARAAIPEAKVTIAGELHLETSGAGGRGVSTDLRNAYEVYRRDPEGLDRIVRNYVGLLVETARAGGTQPPPDPSRIVPVFKSQRWLNSLRAQAPKAPELLTEPFNSELVIVYVEDRASSMRFLNVRDDVGDRARLRHLALSNLHRLLAKIEARPVADGISLITAGGDYDTSLLLADALWSSGQIEVDGDIVAAAPAKGALLVTGSRNVAGIAHLRALAAELAAGPYGLTAALFVWRGGKFVVFDGK
jgi:uncharacterized protein YtpQ (UPF0354 family)